jgi:hypothetical protein
MRVPSLIPALGSTWVGLSGWLPVVPPTAFSAEFVRTEKGAAPEGTAPFTW